MGTGVVLTAFVILLDNGLDSALVRLVEALSGQALAGGAEAAVVHGVLQRIVLPAKYVVTVLSVAGAGYCASVLDCTRSGVNSRIASRQDKWLRAVCGPFSLVVELGRVPDNLQEHCQFPIVF